MWSLNDNRLPEAITVKFSCLVADYVILHSTEPVTQSPVWRALSQAQHDQTLFEERHLRYISLLGKVSLHSTIDRKPVHNGHFSDRELMFM